ncbi:MAG: hypothetical protein HUU34_15575 [Saprospiraceae bacterium]|nr:hypothetical protein [Saprospiraceae bacterium]
MKVIAWLRRLTRSDKSSAQDAEKTTAPQIAFRLMYKHDEIGTLEFNGNKWIFAYSEWFKTQSDMKPFSNFPDMNHKYISEDLPPFFESRIPGNSQPQVEAYLTLLLKEEKQINEAETKAALLKKFGRHTITNPFELKPAF